MTVLQGEIWWAELGLPAGSGPGYRRPVVVVQGDPLNRSRIATIVCVAFTSDMNWASAPGNVPLSAAETGLSRDSVANVSQIVTLDRRDLAGRIGKLTKTKLDLVLGGIDVVMDRH